jgi:rubrerythrin
LKSRIGEREIGGDIIPENEENEEQFVCPMCGTIVDASASECPSCGEPFAPIEESVEESPGMEPVDEELLPEEPLPEPEDEYLEEVVEETEEIETLPPEEEAGLPEEKAELSCKECGAPLSPTDRECPECGAKVELPVSDFTDGCPICGSMSYTVESGDLVSCDECGNVYIKKEFEPPPEIKWKWKFWVGLIFIVVGDLGVALGSYIHNVMHWSPLGDLYLGYGWLDQMVGIVGVVLFILGLILFAWSFKRDRQVQCPSCKIVLRDTALIPFQEEEEEEEVPESEAIETVLEEIGEEVECPECGQLVSIYDGTCPNCGAVFETAEEETIEEEVTEIGPEGEGPAEPEPEGLEEYLPASELDEEQMVMESLEILEEEVEAEGVEENGLEALRELESEFDLSEDTGITCPKCGARLSSELTTCPACGTTLPKTEVE